MSISTQQFVVKLCQTEDQLNQVIKIAAQNIIKNDSLTNQDKSKGFLYSTTADEFFKTSYKLKDLYIAKYKDLVVAFMVCRKIKNLWQYPDYQYRSPIFKATKNYRLQGKQIVIDGNVIWAGPTCTLQKWRNLGLNTLLIDAALKRFGNSNLTLITSVDIDNYASLNKTISNNWKIVGRISHYYVLIRQYGIPKL